jgi:hypothetical protein
MTGTRELKGNGSLDRKDSFKRPHRRRGPGREAQRHGRAAGAKAHQDDDEEQTIVISGTCRAEDVTADNTILSNRCTTLKRRRTTRAPCETTPNAVAHEYYWTLPTRSDDLHRTGNDARLGR